MKGSFVNTVVPPLSLVLLSLLIAIEYLKALNEAVKEPTIQDWREMAPQLRG